MITKAIGSTRVIRACTSTPRNVRLLLLVARLGLRAARKEWRFFRALLDPTPVSTDDIAKLMLPSDKAADVVADLRRRGLLVEGAGMVCLSAAGAQAVAPRRRFRFRRLLVLTR